MRIFDPEHKDSGYNPYEFIQIDDEPKFTWKCLADYIINWFTFLCHITGCVVIGWNLGKLIVYLAGDVNVSFSPW